MGTHDSRRRKHLVKKIADLVFLEQPVHRFSLTKYLRRFLLPQGAHHAAIRCATSKSGIHRLPTPPNFGYRNRAAVDFSRLIP